MSKIFRISRGSFKAMDMTGKISDSIVKVEGISAPAGSGTLVSNFRVNDTEKNGIIQCFGNINHIYAFGHDPDQSGFSVTYIAFLGQACMRNGFKEGRSLKSLVAGYNAQKVSNHPDATINMTIGSGLTIRGILLTFDVSVFDAEINAVTVTVAGKSMEML